VDTSIKMHMEISMNITLNMQIKSNYAYRNNMNIKLGSSTIHMKPNATLT